ncbi:MAG: STAS/SEC14 domain-containing protein [Syntrophobacteraceae bacterium]
MFQQIETDAANIVAFRIGDNATAEDVAVMEAIMTGAIKTSGKMRLLIEIEGFRHMEPHALLAKLKFATAHAGDIAKMAVVSGRTWIKSWVKLGGLIAPREVEHFERGQTDDALEWLRQ